MFIIFVAKIEKNIYKIVFLSEENLAVNERQLEGIVHVHPR